MSKTSTCSQLRLTGVKSTLTLSLNILLWLLFSAISPTFYLLFKPLCAFCCPNMCHLSSLALAQHNSPPPTATAPPSLWKLPAVPPSPSISLKHLWQLMFKSVVGLAAPSWNGTEQAGDTRVSRSTGCSAQKMNADEAKCNRNKCENDK